MSRFTSRPRCRSWRIITGRGRARGRWAIHQTSVYLGTAGGAVLAGYLGERLGWRSPFWVLGLAGWSTRCCWVSCLVEPPRQSTEDSTGTAGTRRPGDAVERAAGRCPTRLATKIGRIVTQSGGGLALWWFRRRQFVAATFLTWLPSYIFERFDLGLCSSSLTSTFWPLASLPGAVCGGIAADWAAQRWRGRPDHGPEPGLYPGRSVRVSDRVVDFGAAS